MLSFRQFIREMDFQNARLSSNVEDRRGKENGANIASIRLLTPKGRNTTNQWDAPDTKKDLPTPAPQAPKNIPKPPKVTGEIPPQKPVAGPGQIQEGNPFARKGE